MNWAEEFQMIYCIQIKGECILFLFFSFCSLIDTILKSPIQPEWETSKSCLIVNS